MSDRDLQNEVLEQIRKGQVPMRPKLHFVLQLAAIVALSVVVLALAVFVLSFIIFSVHESGEQFLLGFGQRGIVTFVMLFPWGTFVVLLAALVLLRWLVRHFRFGYRIPSLRALGLLAIVAGGLGFVLLRTPLHPYLLGQADRDSLPVIGAWYERIHDSHALEGVFRGRVASIETDSFQLTHDDRDRDADDGDWRVYPPAGFDLSTLSVGERVYVAGDIVAGTVHAYGIQAFSDQDGQY